jgi:hypothetical protein
LAVASIRISAPFGVRVARLRMVRRLAALSMIVPSERLPKVV